MLLLLWPPSGREATYCCYYFAVALTTPPALSRYYSYCLSQSSMTAFSCLLALTTLLPIGEDTSTAALLVPEAVVVIALVQKGVYT